MAVFGAADPGSNPGRAILNQYIFKPIITKQIMEKAKSSKNHGKITPKEIESKVVELGKTGIPAEKIGLILRDQHGIPKAKIYGKKISQILKENNLPTDSELKNVKNKIENLKKHFTEHKHDYTAQRKITQYSSKIKKLVQ
tara:strand:+ start:731 stop:1153 length:423 start_codon:yes stop_codon:yes gene_type:complete